MTHGVHVGIWHVAVKDLSGNVIGCTLYSIYLGLEVPKGLLHHHILANVCTIMLLGPFGNV